MIPFYLYLISVAIILIVTTSTLFILKQGTNNNYQTCTIVAIFWPLVIIASIGGYLYLFLNWLIKKLVSENKNDKASNY